MLQRWRLIITDCRWAT